MSERSKIEWTDATWNPLRGCKKISPGCKHCYAFTFAERFRGVPGHPYTQGFDLRLVPGKLSEPFQWSSPRTVFVNSMSDLFQDEVPDEYIEEVVAVMAEANWHTYQVFTAPLAIITVVEPEFKANADFQRLGKSSRTALFRYLQDRATHGFLVTIDKGQYAPSGVL